MKGRIVSIEELEEGAVELGVVIDFSETEKKMDPKKYLEYLGKSIKNLHIGEVEVNYVE